jgi:hypothetical protein
MLWQVSRVRNKWKCTFKDGMIHINGKDYLFAKCTGFVCRIALSQPILIRDPANLNGRSLFMPSKLSPFHIPVSYIF